MLELMAAQASTYESWKIQTKCEGKVKAGNVGLNVCLEQNKLKE